MGTKRAILVLGAACLSCEGKGGPCTSCYGVGLKGVKGIGITHYKHKGSGSEFWTVSTSFLSPEGYPQTLHWSESANDWLVGPVAPEQCRLYFADEARMVKTERLLSAGILKEKVKPVCSEVDSPPFLFENVPALGRPAYT